MAHQGAEPETLGSGLGCRGAGVFLGQHCSQMPEEALQILLGEKLLQGKSPGLSQIQIKSCEKYLKCIEKIVHYKDDF